MPSKRRSISWHGQAFQFQQLTSAPSNTKQLLWAAYRRGEFIGTMPCPTDVTTKDFDVRGLRWLNDLLGSGRGKTNA